MVFLGCKFWNECGVFDLVKKTSEGRRYHDLLLCHDDTDTIVNHFIEYRNTRNLPKITNFESLKQCQHTLENEKFVESAE